MFDALPGGLDNNNFPTGHTFVKTAIENTCVVNEDDTHHIGKNTFLDFGTIDNELIPEHPQLIGITARLEFLLNQRCPREGNPWCPGRVL